MDAKIMLVDDEELIRESLGEYFDSVGIKILTAASGKECLGHLEAGFRGVIFLDVMMPTMTGWDTIRKIVEGDLFEGNIIIMLTALCEPDNKMEGIQEYVTDYMTKPIKMDELMDRLAYYFSIMSDSGSVDGQ